MVKSRLGSPTIMCAYVWLAAIDPIVGSFIRRAHLDKNVWETGPGGVPEEEDSLARAIDGFRPPA